LRVSNERTRLESDKMSVLRDRRPLFIPETPVSEKNRLSSQPQPRATATLSWAQPRYYCHRNTLQFIESKTQTSYFIFHRIDLQSSSFKFPSHHPSDTAQPQDPSYLQLEGNLEALLRCSTLLQHKSGKEKNILCSTELYCHSLTQHHGEMNGHIHTY
jgi:hypothetical protein